MKLKFRLLWALVVALTIPVLILIIYPEEGLRPSYGWIAFVTVVYGGYEIIIAIRKRKGK